MAVVTITLALLALGANGTIFVDEAVTEEQAEHDDYTRGFDSGIVRTT